MGLGHQRWALTSELTANEVSGSELAQIAAAVSLHSSRDFAPAWREVAVVQAFPDPRAVPLGYSPATIMGLDQMPQGALGFHFTKHRQPAANIGFDPSDRPGVATTVSHEVDESCGDPSGNRLVVGFVVGVGRVEVLVEVCDAPEAFTYMVDGLPMSDFVTRDYYGPHRWRAYQDEPPMDSGGSVGMVPAAYSFCKRIDAPLTVAHGGYLSFRYPDGTWGQLTWFGGAAPQIRTLGRRADDDPRSHREWVDAQTHELARAHVGAGGN